MTLHDSIEKLTREHHGTVHTDTGPEFHKQDGLLHQLREAVFGGMEGTGGTGAFAAKLPISDAALDLYTLIDRQITEAWAAVHNIPPNTDRPEALAAQWAAIVDEDVIVTVTHPEQHDHDGKPTVIHARAEYHAWQIAERWVQQIDEFFNPPRRAEISAPCIQCGERYVHRRRDGEDVRSSALVFIRDRQTGETERAECLACAAAWTPDQFGHLANAISTQTEG